MMNLRFRQAQRIRKKESFQLMFEKGSFARGKILNLWVYDGPEVSTDKLGPKLGLIVSRKTSLRANQRNLWKRRIRESFRKLQPSKKRDIAVMVQSKRQEKTPSFDAISREMERLLTKTKSVK